VKLEIRLHHDSRAKHNLRLTVAKTGNPPFVRATPLDKAHAKQIKERFEAWAKQGWPYEPSDNVPAYMVKTSNLVR